MAEIKYTPGPWEVDTSGYRAPGRGLCVMAGDLCVAVVAGDSGKPQAENAHVIAAAPELLAIADEILNGKMLGEHNHDDDGLIDRAPSDETMRRWSTKLRAAIAKAKGASHD
ncbi:hypothetical protein BCh11DRAFT_06445 [Burkholderia sp. Ch1-1]|nr:hypothetical protein BCh11DRAFT_06445 [Burkholderia sp. Ch1-1]